MSKPSFQQAQIFFGYLVGFKVIGVAGDEEIQVPVSPEVMAFLEEILPLGIRGCMMGNHKPTEEARSAMTDAIRDLCDAFDAGPGK